MPVVRAIRRGGRQEGESLEEQQPTDAPTLELNRLTSNLTLADHIGNFVAGQLTAQFLDENLADLLKGTNQIMVSGSWG